MLFILLDRRYNNSKYFPQLFLKIPWDLHHVLDGKMEREQQLSESQHSKSNTLYELHEFSNTNITSILDTK